MNDSKSPFSFDYGSDDFAQVGSDQFGRLPIPHRILLHDAASTPSPPPLFRESELEPHIVLEHYQWTSPPPVYAYAVPGCVLGGRGLLAREDRLWLPPDCFPRYVAAICTKRNFPPFWLGALASRDARTLYVDAPCACPLSPNIVFGHFLLEMLPRIYVLRKLRDLGIHFQLTVSRLIPNWIKTYISYYFDINEVIWYNPNNEVIDAPLFIVPSMMQVEHNLHPCFNDMLEDLLSRSIQGKRASHGARLFLSRANKGPSWHVMTNAEAVEDTFRELGFQVIHPQEYSIEDQHKIFSEAQCIAAEYSSALHNSLFASPGTHVIALNRINHYQSMISRLRSQPLAFIPPADGFMRDWRHQHPDWRGNDDRVARFEIDCGKLKDSVLQLMERS